MIEKIKAKFVSDQENGSRKAVLEELFYDFNRSRVEIYKMNFVRGIFFGFGSVLGGTVIIAILIWILSLLSNVVGPLGDFFDGISALLETAKRS